MIDISLENFCKFYIEYIYEGRSDQLTPIPEGYRDIKVFKISGDTREYIDYNGEDTLDYFKYICNKLFVDRVDVYLNISGHDWRKFQALDVMYGMGLLVASLERFNPPVIEVGNLVFYTDDKVLFHQMDDFNSSIISPIAKILENISLSGSPSAYVKLNFIRESLGLIIPFFNSEIRFTGIEDYDLAIDSGVNFNNLCQEFLGIRRLEMMLFNRNVGDETCKLIQASYEGFRSIAKFSENILNEEGNKLFSNHLDEFKYYAVGLND
jgi:hypothetical protein